MFSIVTKRFSVTITLIVGIVFGFSNTAYATLIDVEINTLSLSGTNAVLAFDFIDGDGLVNNTVMINNFAIDGVDGVLGAVVPPFFPNDVTGALPGTVTLSNLVFFNELLQGITLGDTVSFTLDMTENFAGGLPDQFSFFILDEFAFFPLFTTDDPAFTDALFAADITGAPGGDLQVFTPLSSGVTVTANQVTTVPEPSLLFLFLMSLLSLVIYQKYPERSVI